MNKRHRCTQCLRPVKTCVCKHIQVVENLVPLIILQHPLEAYEAKNTGRLLHLCTKNSQIIEGEQFGGRLTELSESGNFREILLYPSESEDALSRNSLLDTSAYALAHKPDESRPFRLWILDATWRKSRKMLFLNPFLETMPRLSLEDCPASQYTIRKAHKKNQLSSLEASCYALQNLEANRVDYSPVLSAFAAFVAEQHTFLPSSK